MIGIAFLLFISIAYAGVLKYYGKIVGIANVQGPIFYADLTKDGETAGKLLLNAKPSATYTTTFKDENNVAFWSDDLGGINFNYKPKCIFSAKVSATSNSKLNLICKYYDGTQTITICSNTTDVGTSPSVVTAICFPPDSLTSLPNVHKFGYLVQGTTPTDEYTIETNTNGDTYMQVTKA